MDTNIIKQTAGNFDAARFYEVLFQKAPHLQSLFKSDAKFQHDRLTKAVVGVVSNIDNFDNIRPNLVELGKRHVRYRVSPDMYDIVGSALLESLQLENQDQVNAWTEAYGLIKDAMLEGANSL